MNLRSRAVAVVLAVALLALLFEPSQILLNPILLGLSVWAKAVVIQDGS